MKYLFLILFTVSLNAQILPSQQATHYKKNSGPASGTKSFNNCVKTGSYGPSQSDCNSSYSGTSLNGEVTVTDGIQYWTVPTTATYTITAIGATASNQNDTDTPVGHPAKIIGDFSLTSGTVLKILVGQTGWMASSRPGWGAGGGTFVTKNDNTILVIAGGCGSSHKNITGTYSYQDGNTAEPGRDNIDTSVPYNRPGTNGGGGFKDTAAGWHGGGGGGAGYSGNGDKGNNNTYTLVSGVPTSHTIPQSFLNGGVGDVIGGGFGGGAGVTNTWGGGGGGYSGGAGSSQHPFTGTGGGSKNNGSNQTNTLHDNNNIIMSHGSVTITW